MCGIFWQMVSLVLCIYLCTQAGTDTIFACLAFFRNWHFPWTFDSRCCNILSLFWVNCRHPDMSPHVVRHLQLSTSSVDVDRRGCLASGHGSFFAFTGAVTACGQFSAGALLHGVLKPYFRFIPGSGPTLSTGWFYSCRYLPMIFPGYLTALASFRVLILQQE